MNMSASDTDSAREILYMNYNQTTTALSVGTKSGYMLYDLDQVHECRPTYESRELKDICIIERNFCTSLCAFVSLDSPRVLRLYNYTKGADIMSIGFKNTILAVKLNRKNVVVCLEDTIKIYYIMELKDKTEQEITHVPPNTKGLIAMTYGNSNSFIAYPASSVSGDVHIYDATDKVTKTTIPAHTSQLAALAFDEDGKKLATASIKGTVIRVFSVENCDILFEFRRGVKRCVEICSLCFDIQSEFLCASSNTETVHIFKLCAPETVEPIEEGGEGWMDMFQRVLSQSAKYLPAQMSDVLMQQRSFASVNLPFVDQRTVCSIARIQKVPYIMVASLEGFLYVYELKTETGGPCRLVKQHRIEGPFEKKPLIQQQQPSIIKPSSNLQVAMSSDTNIKQGFQAGILCTADTTDEASENGVYADTLSSNGIAPNCEELPPLLNKVE